MKQDIFKFFNNFLNFFIMANVNLFTSNLTGRALVVEKSATRKATAAALANFAASIDAEFNKVIKDQDRRARNVANAAKGRYQTALNVVAACYPYQTAAPVVTETPKTETAPRVVTVKGGALLTRQTVKDESGKSRRIWVEKNQTAAAARGIVRAALDNFTKTIGAPVVEIHAAGDIVE